LRIVNVVGARPNFMKIAPIHREMQKNATFDVRLVHTGQHYDDQMSNMFFRDLELPEPDVYLGVGSDTHAQQTAKIMIAFEKALDAFQPDLVVVVGDVNSTIACSLVAVKKGVKVAHVEAGLRSFDRTMPEEINRILTDAISDFLFVTEQSGLDNLKNEGIDQSKIYLVGNVMIDSLVYFLDKSKKSDIKQRLNVDGTSYALVTLHRPTNVDIKENFERLLSAFEVIEKEVNIVFPVHPRTRKMMQQFNLKNRVRNMNNLLVIDPLGYLDFLNLMQSARFILTDSGGIQEETTYLGIPCITMRENTERPITVELGTNILVGSDTTLIIDQYKEIVAGRKRNGKIPELWDGQSARRIVEILINQL
jgi:UDP-N-acetylglucosamine 2-epimerase (non-hydrolysing)